MEQTMHIRRAPASACDPYRGTLERVAEGDSQALHELYRELGRRVFGLAYRILHESADAEEATTEVFVQIWNHARDFEPEKGTVEGWILTLSRTRSIDRLRARRRRELRETRFEGIEEIADGTPGPLVESEIDERATHVRRAVEALPAVQRQAILAAYFQGLSHTEVAAALHLPLGTIKARIRAGVAALRSSLAAEEGGLA